MLDKDSSAVRHFLQNAALLALSVFFLPLNTLVLVVSVLHDHVFQSSVRIKRAQAQKRPGFRARTVLVTGVGMTKGLCIARSFYEAGHTVIGADFEAPGILVCGRTSKSLAKFVSLQKPNAKQGSKPYIDSLLSVIKSNQVDLWVSCSGVASAVEDGEAKEAVECSTRCRAIQFDVRMTKTLHEKHTFIAYCEELTLTVPETHEITSRSAVDTALHKAPEGRRFIMKTIGMDDSYRGDMTLLPKASHAETNKHLNRMPIDEDHPWILQQYIKGREYCTHSICVRGQVKLFSASPSAELLMHYEALPDSSPLTKAMLKFTQKLAGASGETFTGHCSFDFLVEDTDLARLDEPGFEPTLYPIECNPRAHTAVALFNGTSGMADAYLTLLDDKPATYAETAANGTLAAHIVTPKLENRYYWIGHDLVELILLPLLSLLTLQPTSSLNRIIKGVDVFVDRLFFWKDGTYEVWDPVPWWWLYHVYWPGQFINCMLTGRKWSRLNVSTCKMFEC